MILPEKVELPEDISQYVFNEDIEKRNYIGYYRFLKYVKAIADIEKVDTIHFLSFDPLVKYFGFFLKKISNYNIICTFHHFRYSTLRNYSRRIIFSKINMGVVHTASLLENAQKDGILNCEHIEYPVFKDYSKINCKDAKEAWNLTHISDKILLAIGGTRFNKGVDLLISALKTINSPFKLVIAGKEDYFKKDYIESETATYKDDVILYLDYLSDEQVQSVMCCADIIVLPYRKEFDGASGPLGEGVLLGKCIVGPNHGSLGSIIESNHLGYTFETENVDSLTEVLDKAINNDFKPDSYYKSYMNELRVSTFCNKYLELYNFSNSRNG